MYISVEWNTTLLICKITGMLSKITTFEGIIMTVNMLLSLLCIAARRLILRVRTGIEKAAVSILECSSSCDVAQLAVYIPSVTAKYVVSRCGTVANECNKK